MKLAPPFYATSFKSLPIFCNLNTQPYLSRFFSTVSAITHLSNVTNQYSSLLMTVVAYVALLMHTILKSNNYYKVDKIFRINKSYKFITYLFLIVIFGVYLNYLNSNCIYFNCVISKSNLILFIKITDVQR